MVLAAAVMAVGCAEDFATNDASQASVDEFIEVVAWCVENNVLWLELEKNPSGYWKDFLVDVRDINENYIENKFFGVRKGY